MTSANVTPSATLRGAGEYERPLVVGGITGPKQVEAAASASSASELRAALEANRDGSSS